MIKNLDNLFELVAPSDNVIKKDMRLFRLADSEGWTDGYIADLTNWYMPNIEVKAKMRKVEFQENKPKVQPLLDQNSDGNHEVDSIEFDLSSKTAVLKNASIRANVNPKFLAYFQKAYKEWGGIDKLVLTGQHKQVKVYAKEKLVGLIMPIRANY